MFYLVGHFAVFLKIVHNLLYFDFHFHFICIFYLVVFFSNRERLDWYLSAKNIAMLILKISNLYICDVQLLFLHNYPVFIVLLLQSCSRVNLVLYMYIYIPCQTTSCVPNQLLIYRLSVQSISQRVLSLLFHIVYLP